MKSKDLKEERIRKVLKEKKKPRRGSKAQEQKEREIVRNWEAAREEREGRGLVTHKVYGNSFGM